MKNLKLILSIAIVLLLIIYYGIFNISQPDSGLYQLSTDIYLEKTGLFSDYKIVKKESASFQVLIEDVQEIARNEQFALIWFEENESAKYLNIELLENRYQFTDDLKSLYSDLIISDLNWQKPNKLAREISLSSGAKLFSQIILIAIVLLVTVFIMKAFKLKPLS